MLKRQILNQMECQIHGEKKPTRTVALFQNRRSFTVTTYLDVFCCLYSCTKSSLHLTQDRNRTNIHIQRPNEDRSVMTTNKSKNEYPDGSKNRRAITILKSNAIFSCLAKWCGGAREQIYTKIKMLNKMCRKLQFVCCGTSP